MQYSFQYIEDKNVFAFGYYDDNNVFNYYTDITLSISPNEKPYKAFIFLIEKFLETENKLFLEAIKLIYCFQYIEDKNAFAFGYYQNNVFYYFEDTLLPHGVDPLTEQGDALTLLIEKLLESESEDILNAIIYLNPIMHRWSLENFANFMGNNAIKYYSSDSDDEQAVEQHPTRNIEIAKQILSSTGMKKAKKLEARIKTLINKVNDQKLKAGSVDKFNKNAKERRAYFPKDLFQLNESNQNNVENELKLINAAFLPDSELKIQVKEKNKKVVIQIEGNYDNEDIKIDLKYKYYVPFFRGISYLVDRWTDEARRSHRRLPLENEFINYSEAVIKTIDDDFYKLSSYFQVDLESLHQNAKILKEKLINFKRSEPIILSSDVKREFNSLLHYLQYAFSNGIENFLNHLENFNQEFPGILPNNRNPFVPFSHLPFHAVRYAFGEKNPYKPFAIIPLWDKNGRARKPYIGKFYICIHELNDFLSFDEPNNVPYLGKTTGVTVPKDIGAEYEVSFLSFIEKDKLFKQYIIRYPSFHRNYSKKNYPDKMISKYGLTYELYTTFRACIINHNTQHEATEVLKAWLCLFHSIKAMYEVQDEIAKRKGVCIFRHPNGDFKLAYPDENYQNNNEAKRKSESDANQHLKSASKLFQDDDAYSKPRTLHRVDILSSPACKTPSKSIIQRKNLSPKNQKSPYSPVSSQLSPDSDNDLLESFRRLWTNDIPFDSTDINQDKNIKTTVLERSLSFTIWNSSEKNNSVFDTKFEDDEDSWYSHVQIDQLLQQYLASEINNHQIRLFTPLLGTNWRGNNHLRDQLIEFQRLRDHAISTNLPIADKIYIPINLNRNHWVLLIINYHQDLAIIPDIYYIDPLGQPIHEELLKALKDNTLFPALETVIEQPGWLLQRDSSSCGVWITEIARFWLQYQRLPFSNEIDIEQARQQHRQDLEKITTVSLSSNRF